MEIFCVRGCGTLRVSAGSSHTFSHVAVPPLGICFHTLYQPVNLTTKMQHFIQNVLFYKNEKKFCEMFNITLNDDLDIGLYFVDTYIINHVHIKWLYMYNH